jgi:hypothetical protein
MCLARAIDLCVYDAQSCVRLVWMGWDAVIAAQSVHCAINTTLQ